MNSDCLLKHICTLQLQAFYTPLYGDLHVRNDPIATQWNNDHSITHVPYI